MHTRMWEVGGGGGFCVRLVGGENKPQHTDTAPRLQWPGPRGVECSVIWRALECTLRLRSTALCLLLNKGLFVVVRPQPICNYPSAKGAQWGNHYKRCFWWQAHPHDLTTVCLPPPPPHPCR